MQLPINGHPLFSELHRKLGKAETRSEHISILKETGERARQLFKPKLLQLDALLLNYIPYQILATFAYVDLTYLPDKGRRMNESQPIEQFHIEFVQALILRHREEEFQMAPFSPEEFQQLRDLVVEVCDLHTMQDYAKASASLSEAEFAQQAMLSSIRSHTKAVRNWGYQEQTIDTLKALYDPLDNDIERITGIKVRPAADMFLGILNQGVEQIRQHSRKTHDFLRKRNAEEMIRSYRENFPDKNLPKDQMIGFVHSGAWNLNFLKSELFHRSCSFALEAFLFQWDCFRNHFPSNVSKQHLIDVLKGWSYKLGDLRDIDPEHFLLNNPIWTRPMIQVAPSIIFWPILPLFHSFCFEMFESLTNKRSDLQVKLQQRRGKFLEDRVASLFKKWAPNLVILIGSLWKNDATQQEGENDILILFDSVALVIEVKAGGVNEIARRGGLSLRQEINQLLIEPAAQANRFAEFLKANRKIHRFKTLEGRINVVDSSTIQQFLCIAVTFERFGMLASQIPRLQEANLAKKGVFVCPAMSLPDLEIVLQILQTPSELLHYLTRRAQFELRNEFMADELDLLTYYLKTGFVDEGSTDPSTMFMLYGLHRQLDRYFLDAPENPAMRPTRRLSKWWLTIVTQLEARKVRRRYEATSVLLDVPFEAQENLSHLYSELSEKVKGLATYTLDDVQAIWFPVRSQVEDAVLVLAPVKGNVLPERDTIVSDLASQAMEKTNTNKVVLLLTDVDRQDWPYTGFYILDRH